MTQSRARALGAGLALTVVLFGAVELSIRVVYWARNTRVHSVPLPYVIGHDYGPVPPWMDGLLILAPDKELIWRNRPSLKRRYVNIFRPIHTDEERLALFRRFWPSLPAGLESGDSWDISLNSEGFRDHEAPARRQSSAFRIVCLGDSWTFGMNAEQDQTYPRRLSAALQQEFPGSQFEVLNRGVLGYSSYQGVQLMRDKIMTLHPDVVVIAFAMNDSKVSGHRDKDLAAWEHHLPWKEQVLRLVKQSETYRLLEYLALVLREHPHPIGFYLKGAADSASNMAIDFEKLDQWTRVGLRDYRENIREMVRLARSHGSHVILLYNELWENGLYLNVLQAISNEDHVPLVDGNAIVRGERQRIEHQLEARLGLEPGPAADAENDLVNVVFRVYTGDIRVPHAIYLVGPHPGLGDLSPNTVPMYDDGTHGDQLAADSVWSYTVALPRGAKVFYVYTNSGRPRRWEELDVPHIRQFELRSEDHRSTVYRPIETFGRVYMQADSWHTNAAGYDLIAKGVLDVLRHDDKFQDYVRKSHDADSINTSLPEARR